MTEKQKQQILNYRKEGLGHTAISRLLNLSINTVKSFCRRNKLNTKATPIILPDSKGHCKQCDLPLIQTKGKPKTFCSDKCRFTWWNANRNNLDHQANCANCGSPFDTRGNKSRKYCNHACYIANRYGGDGRD